MHKHVTCKKNCIIGRNPIQITTLTLINQAYNPRMHGNMIIMIECNIWSYDNEITRPIPKILSKTQKPQISQQKQKLGRVQNCEGKKVFGEKIGFGSRERREGSKCLREMRTGSNLKYI